MLINKIYNMINKLSLFLLILGYIFGMYSAYPTTKYLFLIVGLFFISTTYEQKEFALLAYIIGYIFGFISSHIYYEMYTDEYADNCIKECVDAHDQAGFSFPWLDELGHGKVLRVDFNEPGVTNGWQPYNKYWWNIHCKKRGWHYSDDLKKLHDALYVGINAQIKTKFYFKDGTIMEPTEKFFELEEKYFKNKSNCWMI
jgi:hypothetical protein